MLGKPADDRASAMDQLTPEVVVGTVPDAAQPWLATRRILSRHQADPGCHFAAGAKLSAIVDGSDDRGGDDRADAGQLGEPSASFISATKLTIIASSFLIRRSRSSSWTSSSPKIERARSDRSAS